MLGNTAVINFSQPKGKGVSVYKGRGHGREKATWIGEAYLGDKRDRGGKL